MIGIQMAPYRSRLPCGPTPGVQAGLQGCAATGGRFPVLLRSTGLFLNTIPDIAILAFRLSDEQQTNGFLARTMEGFRLESPP